MKKEFIDFNKLPGEFLEVEEYKSNKEFFTIISFLNDTKLNKNTINSILNQSYKDFEWLIFYEEKIEKDIEEYFDKNYNKEHRIKLVKRNSKLSIVEQVKDNTKTNWIIFIDFETYLDKTLLDLFYCGVVTHNPDIIYTDSISINDNKRINESLVSIRKRIINFSGKTFCIEKKHIKNINENYQIIIPKENITYLHLNYYGVWYKLANLKNIRLKGGNFINFPMSSLYNFDSGPKNINLKLTKDDYSNNILCLAPWTKIGGADTFNINLLGNLKKQGFKIYFISTEVCPYEARQKMEDIVEAYYDLTTFLDRTYWADFIRDLITTKNIKLIFQLSSLYGYHIIPWLKYKFPKLPIIDYLHAEDFSWRNGGFPKDSTTIAHLLDKSYTCNNHLKELMYEKMNRQVDNVDTLYIGVDTKKYNPHEIEIKDIETLEFCKNKSVVLFPSRFSYEKRPIFLLYTIKELLKKRDDIVCLMVGGGPAEPEIKKYISKLSLENNVKLIQMKNDIREYYKISDVTIICSLSEGITLTTYESLSMNVPVISADVGGQKEVINNKVGKIIKTYQSIENDLFNFNYSNDEICEYANSINEILNDKNKYCEGDNCRQYIEKSFSQKILYNHIKEDIQYFIKNQSKVKYKIENEEFAIRYLVLFNETSKEFYNNTIQYDNFKSDLRNKLWKHWWWRGAVKTAKKLKIDKLIKRVYFKEK